MRAEQRRQHARAVAVLAGEMIVEGRRAAVQPFGDDLDAVAERRLQHARPAVFERMAAGPSAL